jgi:ATP-dependent Clp protease adaptor protein ClpS
MGSHARVGDGGARRLIEPQPFAPMQSSFGSSVESPVVEQETRAAEELDLPWQVVVHNDPVNLMSYVTMVFQKVFGLTKEKAEKHMLEVHQLGRSILWSGMRERAELYVQQLHGYLLLATLERTN